MNKNGLAKGNNHQEHGVTTTDSTPGGWFNKDWLKEGLPPHIAWPLFVVGLLVLSVVYSLSVVFASRSDGGAQVIDNYYEKAVQWDDRNQLIQQSNALGWTVRLAYIPGAAAAEPGELELRFEDSNGEPVTDLQGVVSAYRPQTTRAISKITLSNVPGQPGVYRQAFPAASAGLWDFEIEAARDSIRFLKIIREEF